MQPNKAPKDKLSRQLRRCHHVRRAARVRQTGVNTQGGVAHGEAGDDGQSGAHVVGHDGELGGWVVLKQG